MQRDQAKGQTRHVNTCRQRGVNAFGRARSLVGHTGDKAKAKGRCGAASTLSSCRKALIPAGPASSREERLRTWEQRASGEPAPLSPQM